MTRRPAHLVVALLAALSLAPRPARAQAPGCSYDRCALRLQHRLFSDRVVQGAEAVPVGRLGFFAGRIEPLATTGESARLHYDAFRTRYNRGGALNTAALVAGVAGFIIMVSDSDYPFAQPPAAMWGLLAVGATLSIAGNLSVRSGREQLNQAIWHYNRSLPRAGSP